MSGDEGAVAVVVALLSVVLFGFGALVVDVGSWYAEKAELQNGADAAALALAQSCATGACGDLNAQAQDYADANSLDGTANLLEVCGEGAPELPVCEYPADVAGAGYVMVRTRTGDSNGPRQMPPILGRMFDDEGAIVVARAVANWGAPSSVRSDLPFTFGNCEWDHYTSSGATYPDDFTAPDWPQWPDGTIKEATVFLTSSTTGALCPGSPPGGDSSGGFGWLGGDVDTCSETTNIDGWVGNNTGLGTRGCDWSSFVGKTIFIPVFDCQTDLDVPDPDYDALGKCHGRGPDEGTSVQYHVAGYAAFYMTGIYVPGVKVKSLVTNSYPCTGTQKCVSGFFKQGLLPSSGVVGDGPFYGAAVIGMAG